MTRKDGPLGPEPSLGQLASVREVVSAAVEAGLDLMPGDPGYDAFEKRVLSAWNNRAAGGAVLDPPPRPADFYVFEAFGSGLFRIARAAADVQSAGRAGDALHRAEEACVRCGVSEDYRWRVVAKLAEKGPSLGEQQVRGVPDEALTVWIIDIAQAGVAFLELGISVARLENVVGRFLRGEREVAP